jgi:hypothetical protein
MTSPYNRIPFAYGHGAPPTASARYNHTGYMDVDTGLEWVCNGVAWIEVTAGSTITGGNRTSMPVSYRGTPGSTTIHYTALNYPALTTLVARTQTGVTEAGSDPGLFEYTQDVTLGGGVGQFLARWDEGDPTVFSEELVVVPAGGGGVGTPGADGKSVLNGHGAPSGAIGNVGDFYIDIDVWDIYGPKSGGGWGTATSLIGPQGVPGTSGGGTVTGVHAVGEVFHFYRAVGTTAFPSGSVPCDGRTLTSAQHAIPGVSGSFTVPNLLNSVIVGADPAKPVNQASSGTGPTGAPGVGAAGGANTTNLAHAHTTSAPGTLTTSGVVGGSTGVTGSWQPSSALTTSSGGGGNTQTGGGGNTGTTHANGTTSTGSTTTPLAAGGGGTVSSVSLANHTHSFDDGGHSHTTTGHTHPLNAHTHTLAATDLAHTHTLPAAAPHTHTVDVPSVATNSQLGVTDIRSAYVGLIPLIQVLAA